MVGAIPISQLISVTPGVLAAGGGINQLTGLILTQNTGAVPDGTVLPFTSSAAVATAFGVTSNEYLMAQAYFAGVGNAFQPPALLYFAGHSESETNSVTAATMAAIVAAQPGFSGFSAAWSLSLGEKQAIAQWVAAQGDLYWFACWDNDQQAIVSGAAEPFGVWLKAQPLDGTTVFYDPNVPTVAGAALGWMASLDFSAPEARSTLAYRQNGSVTPAVTTGAAAQALLANGYSFYGAYANATSTFTYFQNGAVSGKFLWADSYVNQIWLNANLQSDLVNLLQSVGSIPFNVQGDTLISAAVQGTITQALSFGAIRPGVALTALQVQQVNGTAGNQTAGTTLQTRGWYLIPGASTAASSVRVARGPIAPILWYVDGQSVQSINLASVEVQ